MGYTSKHAVDELAKLNEPPKKNKNIETKKNYTISDRNTIDGVQYEKATATPKKKYTISGSKVHKNY